MKKIKLGDIGSVRMCKRILKEETNSEGGIPFYKISTFGNVADVFIDKDKYENYKTRFSYPKKGEVLISAAGTIGRTVIYNGEDAYFQDSNIVWIENEEKEVLNSFLYYAYQNVRWKTSNGSTILRLYNDDLRNTEILIPEDISEQKRIAKVLSNIDRKISINREINRNLEELAKQIYDYWFVQFDFPNEEGKPYKSSGGKMVWNEFLKREIPADWEVKRLGEILVKIDSGKRPAGGINKALKSGIPSLGAECIDDLGVFDFSSTPFIDNSYRNKLTTGKICNNDILVYKDGAYVGKITLFRDNFPYEEVFVNEHVFLIHAQEECLEEYLYFSLKQKAYFQIMQNLGKAKAAQPGLNREDMQNILLIVPNKNIVSVFHNKVGLLFENLFNNARAIGNLSSLRDNLLPLLMNGQVTLNSCLSAD